MKVDKNESVEIGKDRNALNLHSLSSASAECVCFERRLDLQVDEEEREKTDNCPDTFRFYLNACSWSADRKKWS